MGADQVDALVIFGATGDLAKLETFPALVGLVARGVLDVPVVGVANSGWGLPRFRDYAAASLRLNNMDPDAPDAFLDWLNARAPSTPAWSPEDFAPRSLYGDYLEDHLAAIQAKAPGATPPTLVRDRVYAAEIPTEGWLLRMASGQRTNSRVLVLATGWARPRPLIFRGREEVEDLIQDNPWDFAALDALAPDARVLLIGTGLTATAEQAQETVAFVRALVQDIDMSAGQAVRILYGGSLKPENAEELLGLPDVDGALVGGASLDPESFAHIVELACGVVAAAR